MEFASVLLIFKKMSLLLITLYFFLLKERLVECLVAQNYASDSENLKPNIRRRSEFIVGEKFRVRVVLSEDLKNHLQYDLLKRQVKDALIFWTKAIQPKRISTQQILIERNCNERVRSQMRPQYHYCEGGCNKVSICNGFEIPEKYLQKCRSSEKDVVKKVQVKKSDKSDFILFIRSGDYGPHTSLATADTCQLDLDTNRPIAGSITILSAMKYIDYNPGELKRVIIHELGHTFGFDYRLFPYLRHDDGSPRTRRNQHTGEPELPTNANEGLKADRNTIKYVSRTWHTVSGEKTYKRVALTLPSVVNFARNHFRCNELDAVDLESDGGDGNKHSHFERRLSIGEAMSATCDIMASVSGLTLSYFKDTGWYNVDISMAKPWDWGRGQGCEFIFKSCGEFIKSNRTSSPWCDKIINTESIIHCIPHVNAYGICNLIKHSLPLKPEHIHFDSLPKIRPSQLSRFGGTDTYADHCPYLSVSTVLYSCTF
ncbi:hypothetical protein MS3_00010913 [Schistosoma haematobium]|uniref:Leishmanolysin-like peptidase n=1 Tax=Schistosoma haematobium TaxID=6185 RepID=A0A922LG89_SCHHA|nr:hypothetical protein MS3_00010913 [Schistosoma haematobium]KAH9582963.1 hypothetical protein MS3_00010913 [Schistosoma haematobium]